MVKFYLESIYSRTYEEINYQIEKFFLIITFFPSVSEYVPIDLMLLK